MSNARGTSRKGTFSIVLSYINKKLGFRPNLMCDFSGKALPAKCHEESLPSPHRTGQQPVHLRL